MVNGRSNGKAVASMGPSRGRAAQPVLGAFPLHTTAQLHEPVPLLGLGALGHTLQSHSGAHRADRLLPGLQSPLGLASPNACPPS